MTKNDNKNDKNINDLSNNKIDLSNNKIDLSTIEGIKDGNMVLQSHDIIYVTPNPNYAREILGDIGPVISLISTLTLTWATYMNLIQ